MILPSLHNVFASLPRGALTQKEINVYGEPQQRGKHEIRHRLWRGEFKKSLVVSEYKQVSSDRLFNQPDEMQFLAQC